MVPRVLGWLKIVSYLGAGAFLASTLAEHVFEFALVIGVEVAPADADLWKRPQIVEHLHPR